MVERNHQAPLKPTCIPKTGQGPKLVLVWGGTRAKQGGQEEAEGFYGRGDHQDAPGGGGPPISHDNIVRLHISSEIRRKAALVG